MRALIYDGPATLSVKRISGRSVGPADVAIRPEAVGICGSDVHGYLGNTGRRDPGLVMGHEAIGVVDEIGRGVESEDIVVGGAVAINPVVGCGACERCQIGLTNQCDSCHVIGVSPRYSGGFAERMIVPAANVVPMPTADPAFALVEPLAVGVQAVRHAKVRPGCTVLVIGAGMIGLAIAWAARREGAARVFVADISEEKIDSAQRFDAVGVLIRPDRDLRRELADVTDEEIHCTIDAVGISETVQAAVAMTVRGGALCLVGMASPSIELRDYEVITRQLSISGSWCYSSDVFTETATVVANDPEPFRWLIDSEVTLDEAPGMFAELSNGRPARHKVLVRPLSGAG